MNNTLAEGLSSQVNNMEIDTKFIQNVAGKINGIFHAGAHNGREIEEYVEAEVSTVVWVEANHRVLNRLIKNTNIHKINQHWYSHLLSDVDNQINVFNLSNNEESSSTLDFGKDHQSLIPEIYYSDKIYLISKRIDTLVKEQSDFDWSSINYLVTDCQGCDLKVLKGCGDLLRSPSLKVIKSEVDVKELYRGGSTEKEINEYLTQYGFELRYYFNAFLGWGERYWIRK